TIAFDVPGTGGSPPSPEPMRLKGLAQLVAMLVARLGHRQIDVLGVSWGGLLAQQLAGQYPQQVRPLVLVSTGPGVNSVPTNPHTPADRIPNARLRLFDDGHLFLMTRLDEVAPMLREFLTEHAS